MDGSPTQADVVIGQNIKVWRERLNLSVAALSAAIGVTDTELSAWEAGTSRPSSEMILKAAQALNIRIDDLFEGLLNQSYERTTSA